MLPCSIQLPDFQRGWVWDDNRIKAIIASVSLGYPVGALMCMETGGEGVRFSPRPFEGVSNPVEKSRPDSEHQPPGSHYLQPARALQLCGTWATMRNRIKFLK